MNKFLIETTAGTVIFNGKCLRERETPNWHYYQTEDGDIYHFRKEHIIYVLEKPVKCN